MSLLQMSAVGSGMIAAATLLRALALRRLPKWTFPVLWELILVRLLLPVSLPLFPVFADPPQPWEGATLPAIQAWDVVESETIAEAGSLAGDMSMDWGRMIWLAGALALGG